MIKKFLFAVGILALAAGFTACSSDDDKKEEPISETIELGNVIAKTNMNGTFSIDDPHRCSHRGRLQRQ